MRNPLLLSAAILMTALAARAQVEVGGTFPIQNNAIVTLRLLAFGVPIATSSATTAITGTARSIATLSQQPVVPAQIANTQITAAHVEAFDLTAANATLVLNGLQIQLQDFRYRMGDCIGSNGTKSNIPGGPGRVFVVQTSVVAEATGSVVLSGGTPPFAFNQTIDLGSLGPSAISLNGEYEIVADGVGGVQQRLTTSPFFQSPFTFGGFTLEVLITLPGGTTNLVSTAPFQASSVACCAAATPLGTLFDRGGIARPYASSNEAPAFADLDGDGLPELLTVDGTDVVLLRNLGGGTFAPAVLVPVGVFLESVEAADLDADGDPEIVAAGGGVHVLRNLGSLTFAPPVTTAASVLNRNLSFGDVDGDHDVDVLIVNGGSGANNCMLLRNDGTGNFGAATLYTLGNFGTGLAVGNFDGDDDLDVTAATHANVVVLVNGCTGALQPLASVTAFGAGCPGSLGVPQLHGIGRPRVGTTFTSRMDGIAPGAAMFAIGFSNTVWNGVPLPLPLAALGLGPQCQALVAVDVTVAALHQGVADYQLTIPWHPALFGLSVFVQGANLDAALPHAVPLALSNGLQLLTGL